MSGRNAGLQVLVRKKTPHVIWTNIQQLIFNRGYYILENKTAVVLWILSRHKNPPLLWVAA
jgi:hypothetical protein